MQMLVEKDERGMEAVGENIRRRRQELGLSQDDLADRFGSKRTVVSQYENAKHEMSICTFIQYAAALESPPAALLPAGNGDGSYCTPADSGDGSYCTPADSGDGSSAASRKEKAGLLFGRLSENDQDLILQMLRRLVIGYGSS